MPSQPYMPPDTQKNPTLQCQTRVYRIYNNMKISDTKKHSTHHKESKNAELVCRRIWTEQGDGIGGHTVIMVDLRVMDQVPGNGPRKRGVAKLNLHGHTPLQVRRVSVLGPEEVARVSSHSQNVSGWPGS